MKNHRATVTAREREVLAKENALSERERQLSATLAEKDGEISSLQQLLQSRAGYSEEDLQSAIHTAISRREEELRVLVMKREEEVAVAMARREEEIIASVNKREAEFCAAWAEREQQIRDEVDEKVQWVLRREVELREEEQRLQSIKTSLEDRIQKWEHSKGLFLLDTCNTIEFFLGRRDKTPLEEVKNILEPMTKLKSTLGDISSPSVPGLATPVAKPAAQPNHNMPSAMKGVVFTATGQVLATPAPGDLANLFVNSPKVGLNFAKIFEFDGQANTNSDDEAASPPPSPSVRKEKQQKVKDQADPSSSSSQGATLPPTRIRRPSIRTSTRRPTNPLPSSQSDLTGLSHSSPSVQPKPLPHPHLTQASTAPLPTRTAPAAPRYDSPEYDLLDEENLPSPFLKRNEREARSKRPSNGNLLRAVAAVNAAGRRGPIEDNGTRPAVASARKASEEARKALQR